MDMDNHNHKKQLPIVAYPWWKVVGFPLLLLLPFSALMVLTPSFEYSFAILGASIILMGVGCTIYGRLTSNYWAIIANFFLLSLQFLFIAVRTWSAIIPVIWIWVLPLVVAFLLGWTLPVLNTKTSAFLYREQIAPDTRLGRGCLLLMLIIAPAAGGIGATFGMYGSRYGQSNLVYLAMAILASFVAVAGAQAFSHQFWVQRPGAKAKGESKGEA